MAKEGDTATTLETVDIGGRAARGSKPPLDERITAGTSIGRFVVTGFLGAGGMGVVYAARDPVLERRVAIKLWRPGGVDSDAIAHARARLLREAQALAQFAHPNIVAVHEFGTHDDGVFLAMDLVEGQTLRAYASGERTPAEVMEVLRAAGAGLAAAHRTGIIHRDFKPDNVIVATDGGVRVVDFGLARSLLAGPDDATPESVPRTHDANASSGLSSSRNALSAPLTAHGAVAGTPRYMAPDLELNVDADALADQFSFCVTAFECLYGQVPFAPQQPGMPRSFAFRETKRKGVPSRWRRALLRGLSVQKEKRFPSMDALLIELAYDPRAARQRALLTLGAAALVALSAVAWVRAPRAPLPSNPCTGSADPVASAWNDAARAHVASSFAASGAPHADVLTRRFDDVLADYARRLGAARTTACEDTRVRGVLSEHVLDLRTRCLDGRLTELRDLASIYSGNPDGPTVTRALEAAHALGRLESCSDVAALTAPVPPPDDPTVRARVDALEERLRQIKTTAAVGRHRDALDEARPLIERARDVGYAPLLGRTLLLVGRLEGIGGDAKAGEARLREALDVAGGVVDDTLFVDVLAELVYAIGYDGARYDEALRMGSVVLPLLERKTVDDESRALFLSHLGVVRWANGQGDDAKALFGRALDIREKLLGADDPSISPLLDNLGNVASDAHQLDDARSYYERSLAIVRNAYGDDHPDVGRTLLNLGTVLGEQGKHSDAIDAYQRAITIFEAQYGPQHTLVAAAYNNLGEALGKEQRYAESLAACQKALAAGEATLKPDHPLRAYHLLCVARATLALGRDDEARPLIERAQALRASADAKERAEVKVLLAKALWRRPPERARARRLLDEARAVYVSSGDGAEVAAIDAWLKP